MDMRFWQIKNAYRNVHPKITQNFFTLIDSMSQNKVHFLDVDIIEMKLKVEDPEQICMELWVDILTNCFLDLRCKMPKHV